MGYTRSRASIWTRLNGAVIKGFEKDVGNKTSFYGFTVNTMKNSLISYWNFGFTSVPQGPVRLLMGWHCHGRSGPLFPEAPLHGRTAAPPQEMERLGSWVHVRRGAPEFRAAQDPSGVERGWLVLTEPMGCRALYRMPHPPRFRRRLSKAAAGPGPGLKGLPPQSSRCTGWGEGCLLVPPPLPSGGRGQHSCPFPDGSVSVQGHPAAKIIKVQPL